MTHNNQKQMPPRLLNKFDDIDRVFEISERVLGKSRSMLHFNLIMPYSDSHSVVFLESRSVFE